MTEFDMWLGIAILEMRNRYLTEDEIAHINERWADEQFNKGIDAIEYARDCVMAIQESKAAQKFNARNCDVR